MMVIAAGLNPLEYLLLILFSGGFGTPIGVPPTQEDYLLARIAPAECLFYASWVGTEMPDATSGNHTEKMLAEVQVQRFLTDGRGRLVDTMRQAARNDPKAHQAVQDAITLLELVHGKPGAVFLSDLAFNRKGSRAIEAAGMFRVDDDAAEVQEVLDRFHARIPKARITAVQLGPRRWYARIQPDEGAPTITWGVTRSHFLVGLGEGSLEGLIRCSRDSAPDWLLRMRSKLALPRVSSTMYIDVKRVVEILTKHSGNAKVGRILSILGLDKVRSLATVSGMDYEGCVSRSLLTMDGGGTGPLSWIDAQPLAADDLKIIPHDAPVAIAFKLDASGLLDMSLDLSSQIAPEEAEQMRRDLAFWEQRLGINIREDLLKSLGDTWRIFVQQGPNSLISGWTVAIQVRDRQKLEGIQETLVAIAKASSKEREEERPLLSADTINGDTVYTLKFAQPEIPVAPSWCLTDEELFITATPQAMNLLLSGEGDGRSLAQHPDVASLLSGNARTLVVAYMDTRAVAETILPMVPSLLQWFAPMFPPMDASDLPPADAMVGHLQPTVFSVSRTEDGVVLVSRGTLPGGNIGAFVPVAGTVALRRVAKKLSRTFRWEDR